MPSMPGMLMSIRTTSGDRRVAASMRLQAGGGDGDDLDVGLEREQLGEVLTRLGDIVDDDDPDRCQPRRSLLMVITVLGPSMIRAAW